jgi:DNA segregation ATPase FtsK/SpoIIIE, S-DNA-T family
MWCPLVSIAPAIRDGLALDPKGMELAYGRGIFHRYGATPKQTLQLLDDLVGARWTHASRSSSGPDGADQPGQPAGAGRVRRDRSPTRYTDRKTRKQIVEKVVRLTTQGRALGFTVRGYVQEPTKETVPVRELYPRRICLRVTAKSHVGLVLGDQVHERGAWANRIDESAAGVGHVWGEGQREPLRVRAGWVPTRP